MLHDEVLRIARGCVTYSADPNGGTRDAFEALMAYDERPGVGRSMSSYRNPKTGAPVSTCGLFVRGVLHAAGVIAPEIAAPYVASTVFNVLRALAKRMNAWVPMTQGARPNPGDVVFFDADATSGHVAICESADSIGMIGVEAGQVTIVGSWQAVRRKVHKWTVEFGQTVDRAVQVGTPDTYQGSAKKVSGWISVDALLPAVSCVQTAPAHSLEGIDVSDVQGAVEWSRVRAAGISWAYYRGTLGVGTPDTRWKANAAGAAANAIEHSPYGVIFPPRAWSKMKVDGAEQAKELCGIWTQARATIDPMIDVEAVFDRKGNEIVGTGPGWRDTCEIAIETIRSEIHREPIFYTGEWFFDRFPELKASLKIAGLRLWASDYSHDRPTLPSPWIKQGATIHQYAGSDPTGRVGHVDGVAVAVDRNRILRGGLSALRS